MQVVYLKTKSAVLLWDIEALRRDVENLKFSVEVRRMLIVNIRGLYRLGNEDVMGADIGVFPIVASLSRDKYCVLSGGEQIEKAWRLGFKSIDCYYVKPAQHKKYLLDYDEEIYLRAVKEYWEDEI